VRRSAIVFAPLLIAVLVLVIGAVGCGGGEAPTFTPTPTPTPSPTPTATTLDKIVTFADTNLEAAVRESIEMPTGDIHQSDLEELTTLSANSEDIINLTGLEHCTNLIELSLSSNQISDLSPLASLTSLAELHLGDNRITDITPLSNLTSLTHLDLSTNEIDDVSPLSSLTNLIGLDLSDNRISDVTPLYGLKRLTKLHLAWNPVRYIDPISMLTTLTGLSPSSTRSKGAEYAIERVPVEPGKNAYIWPDDAESPGVTSLWDLTKWTMQDGDTLYLREGTFEGPIITIEYRYSSAPNKRIHIRGSGSDSTILQGYIIAGRNSTIENLTVDSSGTDRTSIDIDVPGAQIENVVVTGGQNGISIGGGSFSGATDQVVLRCVTVSNVSGNGIFLGNTMMGSETSDSVLEHVEVVGTGHAGVSIYGDRVLVDNLILRDIGSNGLYVNGSDASIRRCSFSDIDFMGIIMEGDSPEITNTHFRDIGTGGLSINGNNAEVRDSSFSYIGLYGLSVDGDSPQIRNVDIHATGTGGLSVNGSNARVRDSLFSDIGLYGLSVDGYEPEITNLIIKNVGSSQVGTGLILYENSDSYVVSDTLFRAIRVGILLEATEGELSNNVFEDIFYQDVLEASSDWRLHI